MSNKIYNITDVDTFHYLLETAQIEITWYGRRVFHFTQADNTRISLTMSSLMQSVIKAYPSSTEKNKFSKVTGKIWNLAYESSVQLGNLPRLVRFFHSIRSLFGQQNCEDQFLQIHNLASAEIKKVGLLKDNLLSAEQVQGLEKKFKGEELNRKIEQAKETQVQLNHQHKIAAQKAFIGNRVYVTNVKTGSQAWKKLPQKVERGQYYIIYEENLITLVYFFKTDSGKKIPWKKYLQWDEKEAKFYDPEPQSKVYFNTFQNALDYFNQQEVGSKKSKKNQTSLFHRPIDKLSAFLKKYGADFSFDVMNLPS